MKNREFGKAAVQIFVSGADGIAREQDGTEDQKFALKPMPQKTDSSVTIGIKIHFLQIGTDKATPINMQTIF